MKVEVACVEEACAAPEAVPVYLQVPNVFR
jgi:hypothetical protein